MPAPSTYLPRLKELLEPDGLTCSADDEHCVTFLTVSCAKDRVMTFDEATRIAGKVAYFVNGTDCEVRFDRIADRSVSFYLVDTRYVREFQNRLATGTLASGMPVGEWAAAAMRLPSAYDVGDMPTSAHIDDEVPTQASGYGFLWARRSFFDSTRRTGKWCVSCTAEQVDELWLSMSKAVAAGELLAALASTPGQAATHGGTYLVAVFTKDWTDIADMKRVREMLHRAGVVHEIGYKRDLETDNNVYDTPQEWLVRA